MIRFLRLMCQPTVRDDERVAQLEECVRMLRHSQAEMMLALMAEHQHRIRAEAALAQREELHQ